MAKDLELEIVPIDINVRINEVLNKLKFLHDRIDLPVRSNSVCGGKTEVQVLITA